MEQRERAFHPAVYWLIAAYILLAFLTLAWGRQVSASLIPEDHYFENVGAGSLLLASLLFFWCLAHSLTPGASGRVSLFKKLAYLGLGLLFFFGGGEEISWGQRLFNFSTPQPLELSNAQQEFNLHNLAWFEFASLFNMNRLFDIFWFLFAVVVPAIVLVVPSAGLALSRWLPVVPWGLGALFVWNYLLAKLAKLLFVGSYDYSAIPFPQAVQEIKESNYSMLFVVAGFFAIWELKRRLRSGNAA